MQRIKAYLFLVCIFVFLVGGVSLLISQDLAERFQSVQDQKLQAHLKAQSQLIGSLTEQALRPKLWQLAALFALERQNTPAQLPGVGGGQNYFFTSPDVIKTALFHLALVEPHDAESCRLRTFWSRSHQLSPWQPEDLINEDLGRALKQVDKMGSLVWIRHDADQTPWIFMSRKLDSEWLVGIFSMDAISSLQIALRENQGFSLIDRNDRALAAPQSAWLGAKINIAAGDSLLEIEALGLRVHRREPAQAAVSIWNLRLGLRIFLLVAVAAALLWLWQLQNQRESLVTMGLLQRLSANQLANAELGSAAISLQLKQLFKSILKRWPGTEDLSDQTQKLPEVPPAELSPRMAVRGLARSLISPLNLIIGKLRQQKLLDSSGLDDLVHLRSWLVQSAQMSRSLTVESEGEVELVAALISVVEHQRQFLEPVGVQFTTRWLHGQDLSLPRSQVQNLWHDLFRWLEHELVEKTNSPTLITFQSLCEEDQLVVQAVVTQVGQEPSSATWQALNLTEHLRLKPSAEYFALVAAAEEAHADIENRIEQYMDQTQLIGVGFRWQLPSAPIRLS